MVEGSPTRSGTATGAAGWRPAWATSSWPQPFWANTVAVSRRICWSVGRRKRVRDAVVLCVPWPVAGTVPVPSWNVSSGPRASMPRVLVTTTWSPTVATSAG